MTRAECQVSSDKWVETEKDMKRKIPIFIFSTMLFVLCRSVEAQQPTKVPRIGVLNATSAASLASRMELFRQGLRGWVILRARILSSSIATQRVRSIGYPISRLNWCDLTLT